MKGAYLWLIGEREVFGFEERVFNAVLILAAILTGVSAYLDWYFGAPVLPNIGFLLFWLAGYYLIRFHGAFRWVSVLSLLVLILLYYPYQWRISGGIAGVFPYYAVLFVAVTCIVIRRYVRLVFIGLIMVVLLVLSLKDMERMSDLLIVHTTVPIHVSILIIGISTLLIAYSDIYYREKRRNEAYARAIEEQNRQQHYYMESLETMNDQLKSERHDFNNHLGVIYGLIVGEDYEKTAAYTSQLVESAEAYNDVVEIPYMTMRAMLNYKISMAKNAGIATKVTSKVPEGLTIDEYDLGVVLGNLLDNAIEALKLVNEDNRYLDLRIEYKPDYLVVQIKNPYDHSVVMKEDLYLSTKSDNSNHGYGLGNVKEIVQKHNGMLTIDHDNDVFAVKLAMLVKGI